MEVSQISSLEEKLQREKREPRLSTLLPPSVQAEGAAFPRNNQKQFSSPPHHLLRTTDFKPCPLPGLCLLYCRSRAERSLTSVHRRNHFHTDSTRVPSGSAHHHHHPSPSWFLPHTQQFTCILQRKNSRRPQSVLSDHCFTTAHFCGKTTLTAANVTRRCPEVCLESHS